MKNALAGLVLVLLAGLATADTDGFSAGAARVEITPPANLLNWATRKIPLRPYDGVLDPLFVHALVLSDGSNRVALVRWDLVSTREPIVARIRSAIELATGIPATNILINASHSHSAPFPPDLGGPLLAGDRNLGAPAQADSGYTEWGEQLPGRCVQAVRMAESARRPATLAVAYAWVGEVVFNRRPVREDGKVESTLMPANPYALPKGERFGPTDPTLTLIALADREGQPIATVFNLACHAVAIYEANKAVSADWPGGVRAGLQQALGGEALFLQGCGGDIVPARRGVAARDAMAQLITERGLMAWTNRHALRPGSLQVRRMPVELKLTPAAQQEVGGPTLTSEVQVISCGSLALVALPGEPLIGLATEIQRRSPFPHTVVLGYSNGDGVEYVELPGAKAQGGYEMGKYGGGTDECGQVLIDAAVKLLESAPPPAVPEPAAEKPAPRKKTRATPAVAGGGMKLLAKQIILRHQGRRSICTGFVSYVSQTEPLLMHCHGWDDASDTCDDFSVSISPDNGQTWAPEQLHWQGEAVPGGRLRFAEPAAFFDPDRQKLIVLMQRMLYPNDKLNVDADYSLTLDVYEPKTQKWSERQELKFPGQRVPATSFSFPIKTSRGRLLFPAMRKTVDASGKPIHFKKSNVPVDEVVLVIGEYGAGDQLRWHLSQPLGLAPEVSSRGLDENALAELADGRIAAVCRGDNSMFPEKPCYKWLSFSKDDGETWSAPVPLPATGGDPIESGANGSALFRSLKNGKLYWLGNLALNGERASGNWPRSPLVIVEVQEEPFALKRDTIFAVDERNYNDSPRVQLSNFRFYQDRATGDVVIFLTRYGEQSAREWYWADYYRYRVEMPGRAPA